jgi:hypothetical protein
MIYILEDTLIITSSIRHLLIYLLGYIKWMMKSASIGISSKLAGKP